MQDAANRRALKSRSTRWAKGGADLLLRAGLSPNAVSLAGVGFAALGAGAFLLAPSYGWAWIAAALLIQLRLLTNLLDGLMAIEGGRSSPTGPLFNEVPDRVEDMLLLVGAGFAAGVATLGWGAALLAIGAAYIRLLGGSLGLAQDFSGPMAKQHRMAALTGGALLCAAWPHFPVMAVTLGLIAAGTALTCILRVARMARALRGAAQ